ARDALGLKPRATSSGGRYLLQVPELASGAGLQWITDAIRILVRLGLKADDVVAWSKKPQDSSIAAKFGVSLKGEYTTSAWIKVAQPILDVSRKKQRDALVAHLTHLPGAPYGETPEELYEYLLLDPQTEPPVVASRIQLAISSVQLFIQRCL